MLKRRQKRIISDDGYSTDPSDRSSSDSSDDAPSGGLVDKCVPDFGILFDIDGVIARGSTPLKEAQEAVKCLKNDHNQFRIPIAFVTNGCCPRKDKATTLSQWLDVDVDYKNVILAPSPCAILKQYHTKHVLVIGQENRSEIAEDLGFHNLCFIDDIKDAYPLLDVVNHDNRRAIAKGYVEKSFPRVEAILLLGEPTEWESHLQLLIDLLLTEGLPVAAPKDPTNVPQLPIVACNMDLQFMAEACMPRFGHGAFLVCLEALYKKITGKDLSYSVLVGKPCELTFRYAEHVINEEARRMGIFRPIKRLYFIGDNDQVDVVGANLYDHYVQTIHEENNNPEIKVRLPLSRRLSYEAHLSPQTVEKCFSLLVCTGVYHPSAIDLNNKKNSSKCLHHGHRDIENDAELTRPTKVVDDVLQAINFILDSESKRHYHELEALPAMIHETKILN